MLMALVQVHPLEGKYVRFASWKCRGSWENVIFARKQGAVTQFCAQKLGEA